MPLILTNNFSVMELRNKEANLRVAELTQGEAKKLLANRLSVGDVVNRLSGVMPTQLMEEVKIAVSVKLDLELPPLQAEERHEYTSSDVILAVGVYKAEFYKSQPPGQETQTYFKWVLIEFV